MNGDFRVRGIYSFFSILAVVLLGLALFYFISNRKLPEKENPSFAKRVQVLESISSHKERYQSEYRLTFLKIDGHSYILFQQGVGRVDSMGGMVHNPNCDCYKR